MNIFEFLKMQVTIYKQIDKELRKNLRGAFIKWLLRILAHFFILILTFLLAPILPLFAIGKERLPNWLSWFQTPGDSLSGGAFWRAENPNTPEYWLRVRWLWRNPAYGYAHSVEGTVDLKEGTEMFYVGDIDTHEIHNGWLLAWDRDFKYFQYKCYQPSSDGRIHKFRIGWKIHYYARLGRAGDKVKKFLITYSPVKGVN